jgi:hypothetical protein
MSKLTLQQKEQLKCYLLDCVIQRLTISEAQQYVTDRLGITISTSHLNHVRTQLKQDSKNELKHMQKDRHGYVNALVFDRVEEVRSYQRKLWQIVNDSSTKPEVKIKALDSLQGTTRLLSNIYEMLPLVCHNSVVAGEKQAFVVEREIGPTEAPLMKLGHEYFRPDDIKAVERQEQEQEEQAQREKVF